MPGVAGKSGRKSKAEEMGLQSLLDRAFTEVDREAVIGNLVTIAKGTDLKAAVSASTLLLGYTYGKPTERHEVSNPDGSPLLSPVAEALAKVYGTSSS